MYYMYDILSDGDYKALGPLTNMYYIHSDNDYKALGSLINMYNIHSMVITRH